MARQSLATGLAPGMHRNVSMALIAKSLGARKDSRRGGSVMQAVEADDKISSSVSTERTERKGSTPFALAGAFARIARKQSGGPSEKQANSAV